MWPITKTIQAGRYSARPWAGTRRARPSPPSLSPFSSLSCTQHARTLPSFLWRRRAVAVSCPLPSHSGTGDVGLWSASTCSKNSSRSIYFSHPRSSPQPRNPSRCQLIRSSTASPGIAPCRHGSSTDFTINSRCLDAVLLPHAALHTVNPSHAAWVHRHGFRASSYSLSTSTTSTIIPGAPGCLLPPYCW
jgi:hypothetical protein